MTASEKLKKALNSYRDRTGSSVRALERKLGFGEGGVKAILRSQQPAIPSLDKAEQILERLGLGMYIGAANLDHHDPSHVELGPADAHALRTGKTPAGRIQVEVSVGEVGTAKFLLTPDEAKDFGNRLVQRALEIEDREAQTGSAQSS